MSEHSTPAIHIDPMLTGRIQADEAAAGHILAMQGQHEGDIRHIHLTTDPETYKRSLEGTIDYDLGHHVVIGGLNKFLKARMSPLEGEILANVHIISALAAHSPYNTPSTQPNTRQRALRGTAASVFTNIILSMAGTPEVEKLGLSTIVGVGVFTGFSALKTYVQRTEIKMAMIERQLTPDAPRIVQFKI